METFLLCLKMPAVKHGAASIALIQQIAGSSRPDGDTQANLCLLSSFIPSVAGGQLAPS